MRIVLFENLGRKQAFGSVEPDVSLRQVGEVQDNTVDALAVRGDEGRGSLRKVPGSWQQASIRECPNGETHRASGIPV